ncbi:Density-regulated protein [Oopsacas minuta]|uniref:Density-regulated protein n=1 Tax=Oopsacas minuta TaxID=111878 RepID=A0AAV7JSN1_9METZ|nr:Density-regulated protein [Oopsacas minuta]
MLQKTSKNPKMIEWLILNETIMLETQFKIRNQYTALVTKNYSCTHTVYNNSVQVLDMATNELEQATPVLGDSTDYPIKVQYCGVCKMPTEFCEYSGVYGMCQKWLKENLPLEYEGLIARLGEDKLEEMSISDEKKKQTRGGKAIKKTKKQDAERIIYISYSNRAKGKFVTVVEGLKTWDIDLKKATKQFSQHYSRGASITGEDQILIQGSMDDLEEFILESWPEIEGSAIQTKATK